MPAVYWSLLPHSNNNRNETTAVCLLFSAGALYYAVGNDPAAISFDEGKMRKHLVQCVEKEKLRRFRRKTSDVPRMDGLAVPPDY